MKKEYSSNRTLKSYNDIHCIHLLVFFPILNFCTKHLFERTLTETFSKGPSLRLRQL
jgi:hypothetical protein